MVERACWARSTFQDGFAKSGRRVVTTVAGLPLGTLVATKMNRIAFCGGRGRG